MAHEAAEYLTNDEIVKMLNAWNIVKFVESHMDKKRTKIVDDIHEFDPHGYLGSYPRRFFARMLQDIAESKTRSVIQEAQHLDPLIYKDQASIDRLYKGRYEHYREKYKDRRAHEKATTDFINSLRKAVIERSVGFTWGNKLTAGMEIYTLFGKAKVVDVNSDDNGMNGSCILEFHDGCKCPITWGGNIPHFYKMKEEKKRRSRMWNKGQPMFNIGDYVIYQDTEECNNGIHESRLCKVIDITTDGRYVLADRFNPVHMLADPDNVHSLDFSISESPRFMHYCKDIVYEDGQLIIAIPKHTADVPKMTPTIIVFFSRSDFKNWCRGVPVSIDENLREWHISTDANDLSALFNLTVYCMNDEQLAKFNEAINHKVQVGTEPGTVGDLALYLYGKEEPVDESTQD